MLPNGWTDWHQIRYTSVDSSGNGHRLKTIRQTIPHGGMLECLGGQQIKGLGNVVKRLDRLGINVEHIGESWNGHRLKKIGPMRHEYFDAGLSLGEMFLILRRSTCHQKSVECHDLQRKQIKINFLKIKCTNRYNGAAMIPSEAG